MGGIFNFFADKGIGKTSQVWMQGHSQGDASPSTIDANQWTSLGALISYIAHRHGQSEFRIERKLADRFNIPSAKMLPAKQFDDAIRYLADTL